MKSKTVIKGKKGQQLNQREAKLINDAVVEGMLLFEAVSKNNAITLTYNVDGLVSLQDFLQINEMNKRLFIVLMRNIVVSLNSIDRNKLNKNLIEWDICTSFVDPSSWHVYLMYVPLQPYETNGNLKKYLQSIISMCNFVPHENADYVQQLVTEMNSGLTYTAYMLEAYCDRISGQLSSEISKKSDTMICSSCAAKLALGELYCPFCGSKVKNTELKNIGFESMQKPVVDFTFENTNSTGVRVEDSSEYAIKNLDFDKNENGVITAFKSSKSVNETVWLEERGRAGKILVTKFPFRIGKMEGITDYRIYNNAVSRKHADIIREQGQYFIIDLGSTNGTYLNGRRLQTGVKEILVDGSAIRFADAEFKFHID